MPEDTESLLDIILMRQAELKESAMQTASFIAYITSPEARTVNQHLIGTTQSHLYGPTKTDAKSYQTRCILYQFYSTAMFIFCSVVSADCVDFILASFDPLKLAPSNTILWALWRRRSNVAAANN